MMINRDGKRLCGKLVVVVDTIVGSIIEEEFNSFFSEIDEVTRVTDSRVWLVQVDETVQSVMKTWKRECGETSSSWEEENPDLQPAVDYAQEKLRPEGLLPLHRTGSRIGLQFREEYCSFYQRATIQNLLKKQNQYTDVRRWCFLSDLLFRPRKLQGNSQEIHEKVEDSFVSWANLSKTTLIDWTMLLAFMTLVVQTSKGNAPRSFGLCGQRRQGYVGLSNSYPI